MRTGEIWRFRFGDKARLQKGYIKIIKKVDLDRWQVQHCYRNIAANKIVKSIEFYSYPSKLIIQDYEKVYDEEELALFENMENMEEQ